MTGRARAEHPLTWRVDVPMVVPGKRQAKPLTSNDKPHWRVKAGYVRRIREAVAWAAKAAKIPPQEHITVQLHFLPGDNLRRDASNLHATQKPAVDALVDARIVKDDTARWVSELPPVIHDGQGRALWLEITAVACANCCDTGHVCENHPDHPWGGLAVTSTACVCGAGMPCPSCCDPIPEDGSASISAAFTTRRLPAAQQPRGATNTPGVS